MSTIKERLQHAWNAFRGRDHPQSMPDYGLYYGNRPDRHRFKYGTDRSLVTSVFNRIAMDVCSVGIKHVRVDYDGRYIETIHSGLNNCLTVEANLDQTGRAMIQDLVVSMFDEGCVAVVPVDTSINPSKSASYDIRSLRVGKIVGWQPEHIKVELYNEKTGKKEEITLPKRVVAIIENPLYSVINEPNSTLQRLIRKLALLDVVDEQSSSGKLDLIIQLPYVVKGDIRKQQAEQRRKDVEMQLTGSKYGIAYTDATEKITQLNRSLTNNLLEQVEYLTKLLYNQLGLTEEVFNGTADEKVMLNYNNRTLEPILSAIVEEFRRKFLTKTARTQGQSIAFFRDPFRLVPVADLANIFDVLSRNQILTSNEARAIIGYKPSEDQGADQLWNKNMPVDDQMVETPDGQEEQTEDLEEDPGDEQLEPIEPV